MNKKLHENNVFTMKDQQPTKKLELYSNVTYIYPVSRLVEIKLFQFNLRHNGYTANEGNQQYVS